jgi:hypothetical protein
MFVENMFFNIKFLPKCLAGTEKLCNFALAFETEVSLEIGNQLSVKIEMLMRS